MRHWGNDAPCMVSIVCITYNHEQYLRDAMEGFLMQETDFPFEIIIHDDASTDKTPEIISEYCSRYPDIVKPIFQKENQYSKGMFKPSCYAASHAEGQFVALCEGDDYWTSENKLQLQYETLETRQDIDLCFHSHSLTSGRDEKQVVSKGSYDRVIAVSDVVKGGGAFCHTGSLFIRREIFNNLPEWFYRAPVGDYYLQILSSLRGGAYYLSECMSSYRVLSEGSWTSKTCFNIDSAILSCEKNVWCLEKVKPYLDLGSAGCVQHACAMEAYGVAVVALYGGDFQVCRDYVSKSFREGGYLALKQLCLWILTRNKMIYSVFCDFLARKRK